MTTRRWAPHRATLAGLCLSAALAACGGGGGGSSAPADTTAPAVASVTPLDKASDAAAGATISATFSEAIDCTKLPSGALVLAKAGSTVTGQIACTGSTLSFTPDAALATNASFTATVGASVTDLAGNRLGTAFSWQFSVPAWTARFTTAADASFSGVAVDATGNVFAAGGAATDALLVKFDAAGHALWAQQFGAGFDSAQAVAIDASGNVFVGGTTDKDPVHNPHLSSSVFIAKYDATGKQLWRKTFGSDATDLLRALRTDDSGNVIAVGYTQGSLFAAYAGGSSDLFVMKLDAAGQLQWGIQEGGDRADNATHLAVLPSGDILVAGYSGDLRTGTDTGDGADAFVARYGADGVRQWQHQVGTVRSDFGEALALDAAGNIFLLGRTIGTFDGQSSAGGNDIFVAKLDPMGTTLWVRQYGTAGDDYPNALAIDAAGQLVIAGHTTGAWPGATNAGDIDGFAMKLDASGTLLWARQFGGSGQDQVYGLALDAGGNAFIALTGSLAGTSAASGLNALVLKFAPDGTQR